MGGPFPGVPGVGGGGGGFLLVAYKDGTIAFTCGGGFGTGSQEGNVVPTEAELEAKICPSDPLMTTTIQTRLGEEEECSVA